MSSGARHHRRRPSTQAALHAIAQAIAGRGSPAEIAQIVVEAVRTLVPAERSSVWRWRQDRDSIHLLAAAQEADVTAVSSGLALSLAATGYRSVFEEHQTLRQADLTGATTAIERALIGDRLVARLAVPVLVNGTPVGLLTAMSRTPGVYTLAHQRILQQLATHLAIGLEQARLLTESNRHHERLLGLERVAQRLASNVDGEDLLDVVLEEAVRSVGGDNGTLLMWDEQRQVLVPIRNTVATAHLFTVLHPGQGVAGRAIQNMAVTVLHDYQRESGNETPAGECGVRAAIGAPLIAEGRLLGAVSANTLEPCKRFNDSDVQVFELYAGQAAAVIKTARIFESERRQRRGAEEAARAAAAIVSEMDEQRQLDLIIERAVTIVGGVAGGLNLIDPATGEMIIRAPYGAMSGDRGKVVPRGQGISYRVVEERRPIFIANYATFPNPLQFLEPAAFGSSIGVPVIAHGKVLGALVVQSAAGGNVFTEADLPLVQVMADLAAVALENARILKQEQRRRRQLEAIGAVTAELTRELDLQTLLELIMTRAGELVNSPGVSVILWDEATGQLVTSAWSGVEDWTVGVRFRLGQGLAGKVAQQRQGIIIENYREWPGAAPEILAQTATQTVMGVPIIYQERLIGVLSATRSGPGEPFNEQDLELLDLFGAQAAIAIENARLFEQATAAEALRELAQLKAEFLNSASHELRTPLSLIHGYAELLIHRAGTLNPDDVSQMASEIYTGSQVLTRLVEDLLDFSRLAQGRLTLQRQTLRLDVLFEQVMRGFRGQPGGERIEADLEPSIKVEVDPDRLRQILGNLLSNAVTYASEGPISVRLWRDDGEAHIEVTDAGPGLLAEEVERVWETFYRGAEAAQLPNRGSGLGLTVVRQLVELHGGRVGVRSTPGEGATFWFTLPATLVEDAGVTGDSRSLMLPPVGARFRPARLDDGNVIQV